MSGVSERKRTEIVARVESLAADMKLPTTADELVDDIVMRSGLLIERSIGVLGFSHLTFQEYFPLAGIFSSIRTDSSFSGETSTIGIGARSFCSRGPNRRRDEPIVAAHRG